MIENARNDAGKDCACSGRLRSVSGQACNGSTFRNAPVFLDRQDNNL